MEGERVHARYPRIPRRSTSLGVGRQSNQGGGGCPRPMALAPKTLCAIPQRATPAQSKKLGQFFAPCFLRPVVSNPLSSSANHDRTPPAPYTQHEDTDAVALTSRKLLSFSISLVAQQTSGRAMCARGVRKVYSSFVNYTPQVSTENDIAESLLPATKQLADTAQARTAVPQHVINERTVQRVVLSAASSLLRYTRRPALPW